MHLLTVTLSGGASPCFGRGLDLQRLVSVLRSAMYVASRTIAAVSDGASSLRRGRRFTNRRPSSMLVGMCITCGDVFIERQCVLDEMWNIHWASCQCGITALMLRSNVRA